METFSLLLDDFCPQITKDNPDWKALMSLMQKYPIKVTLFIPVDNREVMHMRDPYAASFSFCHIGRKKDWSRWANNLASDRIELAMHGYYHWNYDKNNCREFLELGQRATEERIDKMLDAFQEIPNAIRGFRPPGHGTNQYLYDVLKKRGFKYLCIHKGESKFKDTGMKIIETGKNGIHHGHFGCASIGCMHKLSSNLESLLKYGPYDFKRICDS
jgi:predicted deacetylase